MTLPVPQSVTNSHIMHLKTADSHLNYPSIIYIILYSYIQYSCILHYRLHEFVIVNRETLLFDRLYDRPKIDVLPAVKQG